MVIISFPNVTNGSKWNIFLQYVKFRFILYQNAYYIFNRRVIVDHKSIFKFKIITKKRYKIERVVVEHK